MEYGAEGNIDRLVQETFFTAIRKQRICVEVGAAGPDYLSIGAYYRRLGWRVISIEPNPEFVSMHRALGNEVIECACGDHDEDNVPFQVVDSNGTNYHGGKVSYESFSSLGVRGKFEKLAETTELKTTTIQVKLRKLDTLLAERRIGRIDLLAVDVEGWELEVLRGLDFVRHRPRVMIIENVFEEEEYRRFMGELGYSVWKTVPPNEVYEDRGGISWTLRRWFRMAG